MRKLSYSVLALASVYLLLRWDYHVSMIIFNNICSDFDEVGLNIYEQVVLPGEAIIHTPEKEIKDEYFDYYLTDDSIVSEQFFDEHFELRKFEVETVSSIGPIKKMRSYIIRKDDSAIISRAVTIHNMLGWLNNTLTSYSYEQCPAKSTATGDGSEVAASDHLYLVSRTFVFD